MTAESEKETDMKHDFPKDKAPTLAEPSRHIARRVANLDWWVERMGQ